MSTTPAQRTIHSIAEAEALVGRELVSHWEPITQARIDHFAQATDDHQWIHVDPERARTRSSFGGTIAHGFLTLSLFSHFMESVIAFEGFDMGINYGINRLRFTGPVRAGQRVRGRFRLARVERLHAGAARGEGVQFEWHVAIDAEGDAKPAVVAEWLTRAYLPRPA